MTTLQDCKYKMREAMLFERLDNKRVRCFLCAHRCVIAHGKRGVCLVRENRNGVLYTLSYGRAISQHVDPIEKKPLFHFFPGMMTYSIATAGCNFRCFWCQNWQISQVPQDKDLTLSRPTSPNQIVNWAEETKSRSIAYTYTEPTVFFEYAFDTSRLAHKAGLKNIFVTNGYMTADVLEMLQEYLDAANVDLKAFRKETYRKYVGARLQSVLDSLISMKKLGIWIEVTTLLIPELNDDPDELHDIARFIAQELGADTPWHISRFFPSFKMVDRARTPIEKLKQARDIGLSEGLNYVYLGNVMDGMNTYCPQCGKKLIHRNGFQIFENHLKHGYCPSCGAKIAGVWMENEDNDHNLGGIYLN